MDKEIELSLGESAKVFVILLLRKYIEREVAGRLCNSTGVFTEVVLRVAGSWGAHGATPPLLSAWEEVTCLVSHGWCGARPDLYLDHTLGHCLPR